jgi:hypothetical protein
VEGVRVGVAGIDVVVNHGDEFRHAGHGEPSQLPLRQFREEAFDQVEPGRRGRGEVEVDPRVPTEPALDGRVLVGGIVVENHVQREVGGDTPLQRPHEAEEFLVPVARQAVPDDVPRRDIEGGKQGGGAVPLVVMGHGAGAPALERQPGLGPVQGLDLALLVKGEDHGPLRRIEVEADHIPQLGDEGGILGELEPVDLVGLEPMRLPDPGDRGVMIAGGLRHQAGAPMGALRGRSLQGPLHDGRLIGRRELFGAPGPRAIRPQGRQSALRVAIEPERHGRPGHRKALADRRARLPRRGGQDDPGALDHALGRRAGPDQLLQPGAVAPAEPNDTNGKGHRPR